MIVVTSPIHCDGWKFVGIFALISISLFFVAQPLGWIGLILTGWCFYFFRNPHRVTPLNENLIISPADGRVCLIEQLSPPLEFDMGTAPLWRISIFLNIFDVHVNRVAYGGIVEKLIYHQGQFLNASFDKASDLNERQSVIVNNHGLKVAFVQIAGLIARRIRCDLKEGDSVKTGQTYGLIRFGSRMDIYLPPSLVPHVIVGQRAIAGETILADRVHSADSLPSGIVQ